jgi:hypothetical protein
MRTRWVATLGSLALAGLALLGGCASAPTENGKKASVETRTVRDSKAGTVKPAERPASEARSTEEVADARVAELRRTVERQSRRIAELESKPSEGEARQVVDLVAFAQRFAALPAEEQAREYDVTRMEQAKEPTLYSRIRLAMVLAAPGTSFQDDARAAMLLDAMAGQPARTPLRQLGVLVHGMVSERLREQKRAAQLKEQIDSLRAIERSLIEREPSRGK